MALDRYGDVLPRSILKPRSAGDGNPVYVALSFADEPQLIALQEALNDSGIEGNWQDPGLFHCSLLIVEDATDEQLNGLLDGLSLPVRFWAEVASIGTFEADDIPLIANVVANPALIRLQQEFSAAALRMHLPVFEFFRATAWKPHITLAYESDADIEALPTLPSIIKLRAEAVLLMRDDYSVVRRILLPATMPDRAFIEAGGKGSGFYGHVGRPGEVGGSLPSGEVAEEGTPITDGSLVAIERQYPEVEEGERVDGREVRGPASNWGSVSASLSQWESLPGYRIVKMSQFTDLDPNEPPRFYSRELRDSTEELARAIKAGQWIEPLIVAVDDRGPWVIEGSHRFDALRILKAEAFPAIVVIDREALPDPDVVQRHYGPGLHPGTGTPQSVHGGGGISAEARLVMNHSRYPEGHRDR